MQHVSAECKLALSLPAQDVLPPMRPQHGRVHGVMRCRHVLSRRLSDGSLRAVTNSELKVVMRAHGCQPSDTTPPAAAAAAAAHAAVMPGRPVIASAPSQACRHGLHHACLLSSVPAFKHAMHVMQLWPALHNCQQRVQWCQGCVSWAALANML